MVVAQVTRTYKNYSICWGSFLFGNFTKKIKWILLDK